MSVSIDDSKLPERLDHVHFVAIGGTGMGSLAGLLKARGISVTGSDKKLYPPMSIALADWGIEVVEGFDVVAAALDVAEAPLLGIGVVGAQVGAVVALQADEEAAVAVHQPIRGP